jgi:hypothetical protein
MHLDASYTPEDLWVGQSVVSPTHECSAEQGDGSWVGVVVASSETVAVRDSSRRRRLARMHAAMLAAPPRPWPVGPVFFTVEACPV